MELNENYQMYCDDKPEENRSSLFSTILSCLYMYTIGSCRYFGTNNVSLSHKDRAELRSLWKSKEDIDSNEDHWKKKTRKADCVMRKRIRNHFKDHIRKWKDSERPRFPWKMILYISLVVVVTVQVSLYVVANFNLTNFLIENTKLYNDLFIQKEILYTLDDVYKEIDHIANTYFTITQQSLSYLYYIENGSPASNATRLRMSIDVVDVGECDKEKKAALSDRFLDASSKSVDDLPIAVISNSRDIYVYPYSGIEDSTENETISCNKNSTEFCSFNHCNYNITEQVKCFVNKYNIFLIKQIKFDFTLGAYYNVRIIEHNNAVEAEFALEVMLIAELHSGHLHVEAKLVPTLTRVCNGSMRRNTALDIIVLIILILSSSTVVNSIVKSVKLGRDAKLHFLAYHRKKLGWREINLLFNKWYIMMLLACLLLVITTILKIISEYTEHISISLIEAVTVLFGVGNFLLWCGLFGFLRYFESLNVLLITLTLALPSFLRFAVCMTILFMAFVFCGWVVIGPYNTRFRSPLKAAENLIGLLNGDEIINTFESFSNDSVSIGISVFSKIYLILFVFIFIYIVLSLFIGIFDHAYDSLSDNWKERSRGFLWDWADNEQDIDLTKSYPFPVPRIRNLSSEYAMLSCDPYIDSSSSSVTDEDSNTAPMIHKDSQMPLVHKRSLASQKSGRNDGNINHSSSDSELLQGVPKSKKHHSSYHPGDSASNINDYSNSLSIPRRSVGHRRSARRFTVIKCIAVEPPDANQDDVSKARSKLQSKDPILQVTAIHESEV